MRVAPHKKKLYPYPLPYTTLSLREQEIIFPLTLGANMSALKNFFKSIFPEKADQIDKAPEIEIDFPLKSKEKNEYTPPPKAEMSEETKQLIATLMAENKKVLNELSAIKTKEENNQKLLEDKAAKEFTAKVENAIKKAVEDKKIAAKDEDSKELYKQLLINNFEQASKVIERMPAIGVTQPEKKIAAEKQNGANETLSHREVLQNAAQYLTEHTSIN